MMTRCTKSELALVSKFGTNKNIEELKLNAAKRRESTEEEGISDCWAARQ
jgi:hypothetical protein